MEILCAKFLNIFFKVNMKYITKYGDHINELPGYFEAYADQRASAQLAPNHSKEELDAIAPFYGFAKDVYEFNLMIKELIENNISLDMNRSLDIGGMEGTVSRLLSGTGMSKIADCVDIHDYRQQISDTLFQRYLKVWRWSNILYSRKTKYNFREHFGCNLKNLSIKKIIYTPKISNYFTDGFIDFVQPYKYDFVSALLCMPYFQLDKFFEKLSSIMKSGGTFYMLSDYWWGQCNSSALTGGAPWIAQRLEADDFLNYFKTIYPKVDQSYLSGRLNYYHGGGYRPTLTGYVDIAEKYGFSLISCKRFFGDAIDNERIFFSFDNLKARGFVDDALKNIRRFRDDVFEEDLHTNFISCIFKKNA
jgi:hypothetical protein